MQRKRRGGGGGGKLEGKAPRWQPQKQLDRRLEEFAKAVGGGCCRLQMPLTPPLGITWRPLASGGQWLGIGWAPWMGGRGTSPPSNASLGGGGGVRGGQSITDCKCEDEPVHRKAMLSSGNSLSGREQRLGGHGALVARETQSAVCCLMIARDVR